ncbi:N-acetyltransferase [Solitalea longa]|uniref:N-acetyltransferase n=1 Tax=Solitalea longa TaxID=2079460 RepID=A0A2S5AA30_9SPHI|nr:GNAT family N-acetyltransferase [Solitalea longa]POY39374.1 N-acetyltransferase [Solitalea longa]
MEYLIRPVEEKDLDQLVLLCERHAAYEQAVYSSVGKSEKLQKALFSENPKLFCLVVESSEELVGYSTYTFDFSTWDAALFLHMDCLYLDPVFRGAGIGVVILEILKKIAIEKECINIQWQTPLFNDRAIKFYKRLGAIEKEKMRFSLEV